MYRKKRKGWTKHIDFMLLDVLCVQIAFIISYICRFGMSNPYADKDYRILAVAFLFIDFFVEVVADSFKNVLKRGAVRPGLHPVRRSKVGDGCAGRTPAHSA